MYCLSKYIKLRHLKSLKISPKNNHFKLGFQIDIENAKMHLVQSCFTAAFDRNKIANNLKHLNFNHVYKLLAKRNSNSFYKDPRIFYVQKNITSSFNLTVNSFLMPQELCSLIHYLRPLPESGAFCGKNSISALSQVSRAASVNTVSAILKSVSDELGLFCTAILKHSLFRAMGESF